jgi:hypothetical protein
MSDPNREENLGQPYASPFGMTPVSPEGMRSTPVANRRPGGLIAICVLAIVLGALGVLKGCAGLLGPLFSTRIQSAVAGMQPAANQNQGFQDEMKEVNAKALAIKAKYDWVLMPLMVAKLFVEIALLTGAMMTLGLKPLGRQILLAAFVAATIVEIVQFFPDFLMQRETQALMGEMMPKVMQQAQQGQKGPPGFDQMMSGIFKAMSIVTIIFAVGWLACKVVYYVIGIVYLRKPQVAALFLPKPRATLEWR